MEELIERHMESMTEEINEMRRTKLFTLDETRAIMKKRRHFECKINGVMKNLQDFKDYIQYEKILLRDIKLRRNKLRIADKKNSIEFKILKRIKYLYEIALQRFSNDFQLSLSHFKFCKESKFDQPASLVIQNMIKNFAYIPEVWQVAASWHVQRDIGQALNVIHKGLTIHQTSEVLYSEAIQLELMNREKDDWSDGSQVQNKDELCSKKIETYVESIFKNVNDYQFLLKVLKLLEPYNFTKSVQNKIINWLLQYFSDEEQVWHTLAQREKNGYHYGTSVDFTKKMSTKFCLNSCFEKYKEGLSKISLEKKSVLWTLYLDCLIDLQQENRIANNLIKTALLTALEDANADSALNERYFVVWVKLLNEEMDILRVIDKGLRALPDSVELWKLKLKYAVIKDNVSKFNETFKMAVLNLKEKSAPLWMMALRYHTLSSKNQIIERIYKDGVRQPEEVSQIMKPEYIQWLALNKGIKEARKQYSLLAVEEPYCKELHATMAKIESAEIDLDVKELETVLLLSCKQFGSEDADVWISLIRCYLEYHKMWEELDQNFNVNEKVLQIKQDAEYQLSHSALLLADFRGKYDALRSSVDF
ncbi:U3 small nucleolar RNA-associated protein 6 homolog [Leptinotarsa decemlineata]|uniref:U3 small nucleolar RNA-associated protein 6 homolog n=1 Tax=Leptinotarsa decemlineata TaxID=7539 RepID=UPI003D30675B